MTYYVDNDGSQFSDTQLGIAASLTIGIGLLHVYLPGPQPFAMFQTLFSILTWLATGVAFLWSGAILVERCAGRIDDIVDGRQSLYVLVWNDIVFYVLLAAGLGLLAYVGWNGLADIRIGTLSPPAAIIATWIFRLLLIAAPLASLFLGLTGLRYASYRSNRRRYTLPRLQR